MEKNKIKVLFVSRWAEGDVESAALLDIETGEVTDIEPSNEGAGYEHHQGDFISIAIDSEVLQVEVDNLESDDYEISNAKDMSLVFEAALFEVVTDVGGDFENISTADDAPVYFRTREDARKDLEEHLYSINEAAARGDMNESSPDDFRIRDILNQDLLELDWEAVETGGLVFVNSNTAFLLDDDQPMTCPSCGSRTDFVEMTHNKQRHTCLNSLCGRVFFAEEADIEPIQQLQQAIPRPALPAAEDIPANRVRLIFDVDYTLNDESIDAMADNLRLMVQYAMEEGLVTNGSSAEVEDYKVQILTGPASSELKPVFSVMLIADGENQTFTWCDKASNPNEAIELALASMNLLRYEDETSSDILDESEISVLFVAEGEVKYRCAPGDIDQDRFYMHP